MFVDVVPFVNGFHALHIRVLRVIAHPWILSDVCMLCDWLSCLAEPACPLQAPHCHVICIMVD